MSDTTNDNLYERAREDIDLAAMHMEYWTGTIQEDLIQAAVNQVADDVDSGDVGALWENSLPRLESLIKESAKRMFELEYQPEEV